MQSSQKNPAPPTGLVEDLTAFLREFPVEFARCWKLLPDKGLFFGLLGAWLLLFIVLGNATFGYIDTASLPAWMCNAYKNSGGEDEHGYLIPFVVLALLWWKRKELLALPQRNWWPALALLGVALGLHMLGYLVQQPRVSIVGFFGGIYALMGLIWGPAWLRATFFPMFLFAFCIPIASIGEPVTVRLRIFVAWAVAGISNGLGIDVVRSGTELRNAQHTYGYEVAAACSGLRSLIAIVALGTIYGFVTFDKSWKRILMVAAAFPLAVIGNVTRMMAIIFASETGGQKLGESVHDSTFFSMLPYLPAIGGVMALAWLLREREPETLLPLKPTPA